MLLECRALGRRCQTLTLRVALGSVGRRLLRWLALVGCGLPLFTFGERPALGRLALALDSCLALVLGHLVLQALALELEL